MQTLRTSEKIIKKQKVTGLTYFLNGMLIFLALGYDAIQMIVDNMIFPYLKAIPYFDRPWYALVTHWSFVIVVWVMAIVFFYKWMLKQDEVKTINLKLDKHTFKYMLLAVGCGIVLSIISGMIFDSKLPQIAREYRSFVRDHGRMGIIVSLFQNLYYIVESALVVILLGLMQSAGEMWFKRVNVPWGSIGLCLTWGIIHITHGMLAAIWITFTAFLIGLFYVKTNKSVWPSFLFVLLLFFI